MPPTPSLDQERALAWLQEADGLLITAGAGMGVDSGLPDFRGNQGMWAAYPALAQAKISFENIANPQSFIDDLPLAWGFYGHRLNLYRATQPHAGFEILQRWATRMRRGAFVFTSNVDGQFQKAGVDPLRVLEVHGSILHLQCLTPCHSGIWPADDFVPQIDETACHLLNAAPRCPRCGGVARPNILMFGDYGWQEQRSETQRERFERWVASVSKLVVVEMGAGTALPSVRRFSERHGPRVIRINPREFSINPAHGLGLASGALSGLRELDALWTIE